MGRSVRLVLIVVSALVFSLATAAGAVGVTGGTVASGGGTPGTSSNFTLVGHDPLFSRGMNAALTVFGNYVYVGNRTDGSATCGVGDPRGPGTVCPHPHPGVLIVNVADPTHPHVVGEIGSPQEGNVGITSRDCGSGRGSSCWS